MSRVEYINVSGLRVDGRRPHEIRRFRASLAPYARADGSACVEMGGTKVVAVVYGPREVTKRGEDSEGAIINCEYR